MEAGLSPLPEAPAPGLEQAVRRLRAGDREAFADLMGLTEARVLALAWRVLGDRHLAEDAAQETYLRVFRSFDSYRLGEPFEAWLIRIAVNVCRDLARKRGQQPLTLASLEDLAAATAPGAEETVLLDQRRALIRRALAGLPQGERIALVLRDLEGLTSEEAARILGLRPATVRSQVASARAKVQAHCARLLAAPKGGRP
ncbi:MAG TPA: sigma-70 family RNA polymerase sigma factor [Holophagaceae bacterium]|nr:sigma-70 family RNA polymerase sigma factor [Holophagaceae bacterium]